MDIFQRLKVKTELIRPFLAEMPGDKEGELFFDPAVILSFFQKNIGIVVINGEFVQSVLTHEVLDSREGDDIVELNMGVGGDILQYGGDIQGDAEVSS
jgi:hypothetical protein